MFKYIKSVFSRKGNSEDIETKNNLIPLEQGSFMEWALGQGSGLPGTTQLSAQRAFEFYDKTSAISTSVDMIADEIEFINPVIEKSDGSFTDKSPVLELINNPNSNQTKTEFMGALSRYENITNNFYIYAGGNVNRKPLEIYAVNPQNISITENSINFPGNFRINNGLGIGSYNESLTKSGTRFYDGPLRELYYMAGFSSSVSESMGKSKLVAIAQEMKQQILGGKHNLSLLEKGGRLSLVAFFGDKADNETLRARKTYLENAFAGADKAGTIAAMNTDTTELKEFGTTNKDMDYATLDGISKMVCYNRFKIPLPLVSMDAATFSNMATAVISLYERPVLPQYQKICNNLTRFLMPRFGIDPKNERITYNPDDIPALQEKRIDILKKKKDLGIETTNELRRQLPNREAYTGDGGDIILVPASVQPLDDVGIEL
jgi:HK97 family phage portal protein